MHTILKDIKALIHEEKFVVPYTISGKMEVYARNAEEARRKFTQFDQVQLGEHGVLESFEPERVK